MDGAALGVMRRVEPEFDPAAEGSRLVDARLRGVAARQEEEARLWMRRRLAVMPMMWKKYLTAEHGRLGGLESQAANLWLLNLTDKAAGRLPLSATDYEIREAAIEAGRVAVALVRAEMDSGAGHAGVRRALVGHCQSWGIAPAWQENEPGLVRMMDERWYLRRLRRAHGRRAEGAAIAGGVVRRGLWPYASQDAVMRRQDQRKRNAAAMDRAIAEAADGERVEMADIVAGSLANPENKRAELMVRIRGCDGYAALNDWGCEFWTVTTPSRFHSQRLAPKKGAGQKTLLSEENPNYQGATPRDAQAYLCRVWARARAAWKRRGLVVAGLRTAEPHHDGCPHWHLIAYGSARDLRYARRLLRVYAMADSGNEPGAKKYRFNAQKATEGKGAAAYAAAYVSKNIDGGGMDKDRDLETGGYISSTVKRVDAWASHWSIRQFQFFGMPAVGIWRTLRRIEGGGMPADSAIERARACADDSDWCGFWLACERGGLALLKATGQRLTEYGDAAAARITGVCEGGRRLMLKVRDWVIHWGGIAKKAGGVAFDLPRSCVNNCTRDDPKERAEQEQRRKIFAIEADFAAMGAAIFAGEAQATA